MPDIIVSSKGIEKLFNSLNPHKASGPGKIKHIIVKTLSAELSPILQILFQKSLKVGSLPSQWKSALWPLSSKRVRGQTHQITGQFP